MTEARPSTTAQEMRIVMPKTQTCERMRLVGQVRTVTVGRDTVEIHAEPGDPWGAVDQKTRRWRHQPTLSDVGIQRDEYKRLTAAPIPDDLLVVTRDGIAVSPLMATEDAAWIWVHQHQGQSVDWALKHEGYAIVRAVTLLRVQGLDGDGTPVDGMVAHVPDGDMDAVREAARDLLTLNRAHSVQVSRGMGTKHTPVAEMIRTPELARRLAGPPPGTVSVLRGSGMAQLVSIEQVSGHYGWRARYRVDEPGMRDATEAVTSSHIWWLPVALQG